MTFSPRDYRRRAHLAAALLVITIATLQYFTATGRFSDELRSLQSQRSLQVALLAQADAVRARRQRLQEDERQIREQLLQVRRRIPPSASEAEFLEELTEHASRCGLQILDFVPGETRPSGEHLRTRVRLTATTDYAGFCRFLRGIRQLERLCDVDQITLTAEDPAANAQSLELGLSIFHAAPLSVAEATEEPIR